MILERIVATKKVEVEQLYRETSAAQLRSKCEGLAVTRGFHRALKQNRARLSAGVSLIAEVKKASPSKGLIRPDFNPVDIAKIYEQSGAAAISVLTDRQYFQGSPEYLGQIRLAVQLPLLRKDFIVDEIQIPQARLLGADAVLLIVSILEQSQLQEYMAQAHALGLDALVEVHDEAEAQQALEAGARLVGINNRNLKDFTVDLGTTKRVAHLLPDSVTIVAESGIAARVDVDTVRAAGSTAILVGESLMKEPDIAAAVSRLVGTDR